MSLSNYSIVFFSADQINHGGNIVTRRVNASQIERAMLQWSIHTPWLVSAKQLKFNGSVVANLNGSDNIGTFDVTSYVRLNADNTVELVFSDYNYFQASTVTVELIITTSAQNVSTNPAPVKGFNIPNWVWALIAGVIVLVVFWFLFLTPRGRGVKDKAVTAGRDVYHKVAGDDA